MEIGDNGRTPKVAKGSHRTKSGRHWHISVRLPEEWEGMAIRLVASDVTPYDTVTDIVRHGMSAVFEGWEDEVMSSQLAATFASGRLVRALLDTEDAYIEAGHTVTKMLDVMEKLRRDKEFERMGELKTEIDAIVEGITHPYWRRRFQAAIAKAIEPARST